MNSSKETRKLYVPMNCTSGSAFRSAMIIVTHVSAMHYQSRLYFISSDKRRAGSFPDFIGLIYWQELSEDCFGCRDGKGAETRVCTARFCFHKMNLQCFKMLLYCLSRTTVYGFPCFLQVCTLFKKLSEMDEVSDLTALAHCYRHTI